jgi:hypothetical protein
MLDLMPIKMRLLFGILTQSPSMNTLNFDWLKSIIQKKCELRHKFDLFLLWGWKNLINFVSSFYIPRNSIKTHDLSTRLLLILCCSTFDVSWVKKDRLYCKSDKGSFFMF